ncbi:RES domain-containing protein [Sandaracinobacter neustonicus]|uniref:RES domain-containing protein n=2 Tax=Alphaproteobacteria TaxID=28211 RepID=A0A501XH84_9SPHN|nr:HEPN-associated N-terminal domain-containing protein [Sandaracinobacter neustonicus]TPE59779.1 RES domain-containing protein [Sandaracinobacter neustonicus]HBI18251.1 hypothetical protein [Brevundimonas sp.]
MGRAKAWMLEQWERGYSDADGDICAGCVSEPVLAEWIGANLTAHSCSFCGTESHEAVAASFDDFVGVVLAGISFDWNHPDSEGIMYVSAEGGYQAPVTDTWEVLGDYGISENAVVIDALADSIDTDGWVEREFYRGSDSQRLVWGWDRFKAFTKNDTRYFFLKREPRDDDELTPAEMLSQIAKMIRYELGGHGLVKSLEPETELIRIRIDGVGHGGAAAIGAPPAEFATQSNRMSPAGIPMFYGAFDAATATAETFDPQAHAGQVLSIGSFRPVRALRVLDLAELPEVPSVFEPAGRKLIHTLRFLRAFARDIAKPIARDGREHIEYVPTQIVTEYFRRVFRTAEGHALDGIIYRSSRNPSDRAFVLFCENRQCIDEGVAVRPEHLLKLVSVTHQAAGDDDGVPADG